MFQFLHKIFESSNMPTRRPVLRANFESNIAGLYIIGDLAGAPVVKLAMEQGNDVAAHIAAKPDARGGDPNIFDIVVIGSGAAGLNAALGAQDAGLRVLVLEKSKIANKVPDQGFSVAIRRRRHNSIKARAPVINMKKTASIAAPSCLSIKAVETPGSLLMARCAPMPLKKVGRVSSAIAAKMIKLDRFRSSFLPMKEAMNRPRATIVPMIGK